ncbi:hypothetical protein GCM10007382_19720 [Salinibacterium xinjiangense]|uniref:Integral membrane protein, YkoY family n=1 Tax=Salinibacterium xinjiangense TaxID=386302 RepID=A0A2C8YT75_9MICO|nr:DUF475 domain-containing protein [Salinibacterium xinjiangense]GGK99847.1 hypothetical protein GCM10007382_19720 [Salinibacterium xinjiangense]SOE53910.1 hypothetical protein SAMN06296378_0627 [Salinibacterium xinjiangense]
MILRTFGWSFGITALGAVLGFLYGGPIGLSLVLILIVLEISLSFDNAVVNATVLERMNAYWQRLFLTVGVVIAVFGMRLVFPLVVVGVSASLSPWDAVSLALNKGDIKEPGSYAYVLHEAHPAIAAFGGIFLLMLFLNFVFEERDVRWLRWIERPLERIGRLDYAAVVVALLVLALSAQFLASEENRGTVLFAGVIGLGSYLLISALGSIFEKSQGDGEADGDSPVPSGNNQVAKVAGRAAFFLFLYLEVLDASFSFDGVIGAFAITSDPVIIAIGLGVGAFYIRSFTIFLVRKGTLREFVYLEHGALWAVGALAVILLITIRWEVPELVTGLFGVGFIAAGWISSVVHTRTKQVRGEAELVG